MIDFEKLNAYVDGELDAQETASVAQAIANDPGLARQVSSLTRLRSSIAEGLESPVILLPEPPRQWMAGAAIGFVLAFIVGAAVIHSLLDRPASLAWLDRAWEVHDGWSIDQETGQPKSGVLLAGLSEIGPGAYIPDLSAARLSIARIAVVPHGGGVKSLLAGYRGTRGCKISLLVFSSAEGFPDSMEIFRKGKQEAYGWRAGELGYLILSEGMDPPRFALIADSVRRTSLERIPVGPEIRTALRKSRDESAPCFG